MGVRVMTISEQMLAAGSGLVTMSEIVNFVLAGGAAWIAWTRGFAELRKHSTAGSQG